jgi:hypothetical protein
MVRDDERVYQFPHDDQHFQPSLPVASDRSQSK